MNKAASVGTCAAGVDFAAPDLGEAELEEVLRVLRSGWLSTGPRVIASSRRLPTTSASSTRLPAATTPRTRAWLPVHFAGRPIDAAGFRRAADRLGVALIEDAAHAVEAVSAGAKVGATADMTAFSFYATKNLTTGEGGMVTTDSDSRAELLRTASLHGMSRGAWSRYGRSGAHRDDVVFPGFKYNMTDVQAAMGIHQLASLDRRHLRREQIWRRYDAALATLPIDGPAPVAAGDRHARHLYTVLVDEARCGLSRDHLQAAMGERGISTSVHFTALHLHSYYADRFQLRRGTFPVAETISDRTLSLPLSSALTDEAVERVVEVLDELLG